MAASHYLFRFYCPFFTGKYFKNKWKRTCKQCNHETLVTTVNYASKPARATEKCTNCDFLRTRKRSFLEISMGTRGSFKNKKKRKSVDSGSSGSGFGGGSSGGGGAGSNW